MGVADNYISDRGDRPLSERALLNLLKDFGKSITTSSPRGLCGRSCFDREGGWRKGGRPGRKRYRFARFVDFVGVFGFVLYAFSMRVEKSDGGAVAGSCPVSTPGQEDGCRVKKNRQSLGGFFIPDTNPLVCRVPCSTSRFLLRGKLNKSIRMGQDIIGARQSLPGSPHLCVMIMLVNPRPDIKKIVRMTCLQLSLKRHCLHPNSKLV